MSGREKRPAERKSRKPSRGIPEKQGKTDYTVYRFSGKELLRYGAAGALLGCAAVWLVYQRVWAAPLAAAAAAVYLSMTRKRLRTERQQKLQYHFRDLLSSLHTAMTAGYSLENGIRSAGQDLEKLYGPADDLVREMKEMLLQMSYQQPAEQLFRDLGERSGVEEIRNFGEILTIAKRTGGSMDRVLGSTWHNLCEKIDTAREIDAMTAAKRYEQKLMCLMPAGIVVYLKLSFPGFLDSMYGNAAGAAVMTGCLAVYLAAFFLGRRITDRGDI